ncbi:MAG: GNAT family N-acetyltransferase [Clostridia bacterium]|nr:GNAT family N-acetyltransferase [Clostridia bacterium]
MILKVDGSNIREAARIHSVAWQASHRAFCQPDFVERHTPERQQAYLQDKMDRGAAVYMLVADSPAGIVSVTGNLIEDLYVLPALQNRGYGTQLLRYAISKCDGAPALWILENNENAARLYRRLGFAETGRRNEITHGLDEIEFALTGNPRMEESV